MPKKLRRILLAMLTVVPLVLVTAQESLAQQAVAAPVARRGPLRVHPGNPRYFTDDSGRAIYLTGSHTWLNLQDGGPQDPPPAFDYPTFLDTLAKHNHNFFRLWVWEGSAWTWERPEAFAVIAPLPFTRTGPGKALDSKPKFDLTRLNQVYFDRLRRRVIEAGDRGMYVGVMLFEGFSVAGKHKGKNKKPSPWPSHPFHRDNNVNGINGDPDGDGEGYEIHTLQIPEITKIQEAYVRKVIDTLNDLDNVLYEICNEGPGRSTAWQYHLIDFIRRCEKTRPKQHLIWMSFQWDGFDLGKNETLFKSLAEVVSPGSHFQREYYTDPPVADGAKVIILDTDHINPADRKRAGWVWRTFLRGMHPILMDDPPETVKYFKSLEGAEETRRAMGHTLAFAQKMDLARMTPTDRPKDCSTRYCLRNLGKEYLVYQPDNGPFTVHLEAGSYRYEWFQPREGKVVDRGTVEVKAASTRFTPPFDAAAVLHLVAASGWGQSGKE